MRADAVRAESVSLGLRSAQVRGQSKFYWGMSALLLLIVLAGFSPTFFMRPLFEQTGVTLPYAYVHGSFMSVWYFIFFCQTTLVAVGRTDVHRQLGRIGAAFGLAALVSTAFASWRMLPTSSLRGFDVTNDATLPIAASLFWGNMGVVITFTVLLSLGIYSRRRPEFHRRFMLFVFISTVTPAIARIAGFLEIPGTNAVRNAVAIGILMGIVVLYEVLANRRIHVATGGCILLIILQRAIFSFTIPASDFGLEVARTLRTTGTL